VTRRKQIKAEVDRMFTPMVMEINFNVYEDLLWGLLNNLMRDPNQIVIQDMKITNGNETLWPDSISRPFSGAGANRAAAQPQRRPRNDLAALLLEGEDRERESSAESSVPIAGLTERRQRTTGGELLHVSMRVALYRLNDEATRVAEEN
jgi:hypothetical protein